MKKRKLNLRVKTEREVFRDYLIGEPIQLLPASKLPIKRLILQRMRGLHEESSLSSLTADIRDVDIARTISQELESLWQKAAIPCQRQDVIQKLVKKSMDELASLMKHWSRLKPENDPLKSYSASLDNLFDLSHADLQYRLSTSGNPAWKEDWKFYLGQKQVPQIGSMAGRDILLHQLEVRHQKMVV